MCGKKVRAAEQSPSYRNDPAVAAQSELSYQIPAADRPGAVVGWGRLAKQTQPKVFIRKEKKKFRLNKEAFMR